MQVILNRFLSFPYVGITGHVRIDDNGDRDADYSIIDLDPITGRFEVVAHYYGLHRYNASNSLFFVWLERKNFYRRYSPVKGKKIHWPGGREGPPADIPRCGFLGNSPACHGRGTLIEFCLYHSKRILFYIRINSSVRNLCLYRIPWLWWSGHISDVQVR